MIALITLLAWQFAGRKIAHRHRRCRCCVVSALGIWSEAMVTLSLVLTSLLFCLLVGLPLGVLLASSDRAQRDHAARCSTRCRPPPPSSTWCRW